MNIANTVFLQITGIGTTTEIAAQKFMEAFQQAMTENPGLATRDYIGRPYLGPMYFIPDSSGFGKYTRHANIAFEKQPSDPADGWDYTAND